ncbi:M42 family metallopeptidase [Miniphocaeibacter halophilus]|uniref:M42 family metallopeptidase n=1 Tax=Miniphocaeibacter halophilus TaxID=2931922 RepID=A0AC61MQL2_9FIRM|nr:M42 family metallopeptidase [Miniphocaeibacter halophilus]QQK07897.1 M42 family metallopeptidase [Miniphocaeibacter halophilus]
MKINNDYLTDFLKNLLQTPSPTGDTEKAIKLVEEEFNKIGLKNYKTIKGALIGTIPGKKKEAITFSGHVDTLGLMVKEIKSNGRLKVTKLGGYSLSTIEGNYVKIITSENKEYSGTVMFEHQSVHVYDDVNSAERTLNNIEIRIDELVKSKEDVEKLGIQVGDFIYLNPNVEIFENGFIKSRHLDDKAGIAAMLGIANYFIENKITPEYTVNFFVSNYEEVGHGSSAGLPENTEYFIAVDMAAIGDTQTSEETSTTICVKDGSGPYDLETRRILEQVAKERKLDYKIDIYINYGSDASAALRAGYDFKVGLIGPGVDASHAFERTHIKGITNTIELGIGFVEKIK